MDHEYDVLGGYVPSFVQHLRDTGARLGLRVGLQAHADMVSVGEGDAVEEDAEPHALSNWTPAEHDALFRAISVHSRWRPDLIAACIPTKTEWEVWMYLEALEEGAAMLAVREDGDVNTENGRNVGMQMDSDVRSYSSSNMDRDDDEDEDMDVHKELCEPALEVSQDWIDAEECMAFWIIEGEHLASLEDDAGADTAQMESKPPKRKRGRPRKGRAQSKVREQMVSNLGSPPSVRRSPPSEPASPHELSRDSSIVPARKREALMSRLEIPHLLVLDSILREGEEALVDRSRSREGSVTVATLTEHGNDGAPRPHDRNMSSLSDRITGPGTGNAPECSSNVVIDPVLLALSGDADPVGCHSGQVRSETTTTSCAPVQGPPLLPNTSSQPASLEASPQPGTSMFTFLQDEATPNSPDTNANAESELSMLSPRSRRRIQKRLYMRRKRALLRGDSAASEGGIEKLRPGKKAKSERSEPSVASASLPCSEAPSDDEAEFPEDVPKKNKPGLTLPYKLKAKFAESGVDAAYLRDRGMDLLNLGALGRLMGLYSSLEHGEEEGDEPMITESIDSELIRHLQAGVVSFVTDVMHRAIVWREREIRLKGRSRVWRQGDQLTIGAVEHAVEAIGARYQSHKLYFRSLEAFHGLSTEAPSAPATTAKPNPGDASTGLPGLSTHLDVYMPLVFPPSAWKLSSLACLARTYEREATRTRRGTSEEIDEDELMSDEADEEAEEAELRGEDEVDGRDMALSATHEQGLWEGVRGNK